MEKNVNLKNLTPFTADRQPSPEAKSKGWEERRQKQKLMDMLADYGDMNYKEITKMVKDIEDHPENYTLDQVKLASYMSKDKYVTDYLDRMGVRAKAQLDITSNDETLQGVQLITDLADDIQQLIRKRTDKDSSP